MLELISEWSVPVEVSLQDACHKSESYLARSASLADFILISMKQFIVFFGQINSGWSLGWHLANFYVASYRYIPLCRS